MSDTAEFVSRCTLQHVNKCSLDDRILLLNLDYLFKDFEYCVFVGRSNSADVSSQPRSRGHGAGATVLRGAGKHP